MSNSSDPFSTLIGKALVEPQFRAMILDPAQQVAALQEVGIANPTPAQIQALNNSISALQSLYGAFQLEVGAG